MHRETIPEISPQSGDNEGPCHGKTNEQKTDVETTIPSGKVTGNWTLLEKVQKYIKKPDVETVLSKLNEGLKNIIEEFLDETEFDENKYKKNINKARNIVDNWEDGFPVRKSKTEADLKKN